MTFVEEETSNIGNRFELLLNLNMNATLDRSSPSVKQCVELNSCVLALGGGTYLWRETSVHRWGLHK